MPQTATHPLIRSFLRSRRRWSDAHRANATSTYNRWCDWLAQRPDGPVDLCSATGDDCADYLAQRAAAVSSTTAHKDYQFLMWLYEWLQADGELPQVRKAGRLVDQPARGPMSGVDAPKVIEPAPERIARVDALDYRRLMASFDKRNIVDCRDAAIVSLMWRTGPRRAEVAGAEYDRLDMDTGELELLGKNNKWRTIPLAEETMQWFERYLRRRTDDATALFASTRRRDDAGHMRPDGISEMLDRRCDRASVGHLATHQFRRAACCDMRDRGIPDNDIIEIMGWEPTNGVKMIARYTRSDKQALAHAAFRRTDETARRGRPRVSRLRSVNR